jgi:hypothetical protein
MNYLCLSTSEVVSVAAQKTSHPVEELGHVRSRIGLFQVFIG